MHASGGPPMAQLWADLRAAAFQAGKRSMCWRSAVHCTFHADKQHSGGWAEAAEACMTDQVCVPQEEWSPFMLRRCSAKSHGRVPWFHMHRRLRAAPSRNEPLCTCLDFTLYLLLYNDQCCFRCHACLLAAGTCHLKAMTRLANVACRLTRAAISCMKTRGRPRGW